MSKLYGWYYTSNAGPVEFRYPADNEDDLRVDGKTVTVEVRSRGGWVRRRGVVAWAGGNYVVTRKGWTK